MSAAKEDLRRTMRERRMAMTASEIADKSDAATRHLLALPELTRPGVVGLFASMPERHEIDTRGLAAALRERGARLAYPRASARDGARRLRFHLVASPARLVASSFGVPEPEATLPEFDLAEIDVFVVPGLAFDGDGGRLGWGRAHYDHTLAAAPRALRVGFGFELQVVSAVPVEAGDQRMDWLATEAGARPTTAALHGRPR
jgi:5-formyltetrahydrofolate cyclo-ligase